MQDTTQIKERIVSFIRVKGPSLPVHIAKEINQSSLFTSAFLSELLSEKRIKMTHLRVGSSPLYFLEGQEPKLEQFSKYLNTREREAYHLLQEKKILEDDKQEPVVRVALRAIKDFAIPFGEEGKLFWRYFIAKEEALQPKTEEKAKEEPKPKETKKEEPQIEPEQVETVVKQEEKIKEKKEATETKEEQSKEIHPITEAKPEREEPQPKTEEKPKEEPKLKKIKKKEHSEFVQGVLTFLKEKQFSIKEEIYTKKREYSGIISVPSALGAIHFLFLAKDKKKVGVEDIMDFIKEAKTKNIPACFAMSGDLNKKAKEYFEDHEQLVKVVKIE